MGRKGRSSAVKGFPEGPEASDRHSRIRRVVRALAPGIPSFEYSEVVDHAVGSPGLRHAAPETAAWLSLVAVVRHVHTDYDSLLDSGYAHEAARFFVLAAINATLKTWGCRRQVSASEASDP